MDTNTTLEYIVSVSVNRMVYYQGLGITRTISTTATYKI